MKGFIDLRSDTVTQPTIEMRQAMYDAVVGDDIQGEDPTVRELELMAAEMLGKEDGLFLTSGSLANQVAVMTFTNRGEEVIVGDTSHIYNLEVAGLSTLSQVQARITKVPEGIYDLSEIKELIQEPGIQRAKTSLICIENTNNLNAGLVVPIDNINSICEIGKNNNVPIYMDGARIFNAAAASNNDVRDIVKNVDAAMFALSKGLCAPFGAVLVGSKPFIEKARWIKQRLGGGFRQAGFMAAPGIVALQTMLPQLQIDHENAKRLGERLNQINGVNVDVRKIHTNIISANIEKLPMTIEDFLEKLYKRNIKAKRISNKDFRMVTHFGVREMDVNNVIKVVEEIANQI